ncbi:HNH endonuclease [Geodermatophilus sp. SYSU D00758]
MPEPSDYLALTANQAREQWQSILTRRLPEPGKRQVDFLPVETLLCLAASLKVNHRKYGSTSAHRAEPPVPQLAQLFSRPNSSVLAKMANLDGSRPNGARHESVIAAELLTNLDRLNQIYRLILESARRVSIGTERLPDFLDLEDGIQEIGLLGQSEIDMGAVESEAQAKAAQWAAANSAVDQAVTERLLTAAARVGQHRFALGVLENHGYRCVFCGLAVPGPRGRAARMLTASHIKPWRSSTSSERLDITNGLAACPTHDVAFDTGLLTVDVNLRVLVLPEVEAMAHEDDAARAAFGRPPLFAQLSLPSHAQPPGSHYLRWHGENIWQARVERPLVS